MSVRRIHAVLAAALALSLPHDAAAQRMTLRRAVPVGQPPAEFMGGRTITIGAHPGAPMSVNSVVQRRQCEVARVCQSGFRMPQTPLELQEPGVRGCMSSGEKVVMPFGYAAAGWGVGFIASMLAAGVNPAHANRTADLLIRGGMVTGLVVGAVASATSRSCTTSATH